MWKKISSNTILKHPRITIIEDTVLLPNGHETKYIKFGYEGDAVTLICIDITGKILLQKEYSYPPNQELIQFPGGGLSIKEDVLSGANRELGEEMNLQSSNLKLIGKYLINNRRSQAYMHVILAKDLTPVSMQGDIEEIIKPLWLDEEEIDLKIRNGEIINPHSLASWSIFKSYKGIL